MTKYLKLIIIFFLPMVVFAQTEDLRKGKFLFNIGPEHRITPIYKFKNSDFEQITAYTNIDFQNSGAALNLGVEYFILNNLSVGFTNSIRYDLVNSEFNEISDPVKGIKKADYKLLMGYHFYLTYYFKVFKKGEIFGSVGYSFLNRNSEFTEKYPVYDQDGNYFASAFTITNYSYSANKIELGYQRGKGKLSLGIYQSGNTPYFNVSNSFIVPFVRGSYTFGKW